MHHAAGVVAGRLLYAVAVGQHGSAAALAGSCLVRRVGARIPIGWALLLLLLLLLLLCRTLVLMRLGGPCLDLHVTTCYEDEVYMMFSCVRCMGVH